MFLLFAPMNFVSNLYYLGVGMLCILIVMGILIAMTMLLNTITAPKKKKNDSENPQ